MDLTRHYWEERGRKGLVTVQKPGIHPGGTPACYYGNSVRRHAGARADCLRGSGLARRFSKYRTVNANWLPEYDRKARFLRGHS